MKQKIKRAILWGFTIMLGLIVSDMLRGLKIDILHVVLGGLVMGIVDYCFSLYSDKNKKKS